MMFQAPKSGHKPSCRYPSHSIYIVAHAGGKATSPQAPVAFSNRLIQVLPPSFPLLPLSGIFNLIGPSLHVLFLSIPSASSSSSHSPHSPHPPHARHPSDMVPHSTLNMAGHGIPPHAPWPPSVPNQLSHHVVPPMAHSFHSDHEHSMLLFKWLATLVLGLPPHEDMKRFSLWDPSS